MEEHGGIGGLGLHVFQCGETRGKTRNGSELDLGWIWRMYGGIRLLENQFVVFYKVLSSSEAGSEMDLMNVSRTLAPGGSIYCMLRIWNALESSFVRTLPV